MNMSTTAEQEKLSIQIESFGPTAQQMEDIGRRILQHDSVRRSVGIGKHRLLNIELIDPTPDADKPDQPRVPELFRAAIHDYVSTRTFIAEGPINALERLTVSETAEQPNATAEEFQEAVEALRGNSAFAGKIAQWSACCLSADTVLNRSAAAYGPY
jgi:hypothetical protein